MDRRRFDALARALSAAGSRREAFAALLGVFLGLGPLTTSAPVARDRKRKGKHKHRNKSKRRGHKRGHIRPRGRNGECGIGAEGPCGDGCGPDNWCRRDRDCCTRHCNKKKRRCRCLKEGQPCALDRLCCPGRTGRTCRDGICQLATNACEETCSGCCDMVGDCQPGTARDACGSGGGACQTCAEGQRCAEGSCLPLAGTPVPTEVPTEVVPT